MQDIIPPKRVIINFTRKCALNCEWCYVPFGSQVVSKELLSSVVQRVSDLGFNSITFGGGDPFQFKYFDSVIKQAKNLGLFVHVDTHAITLLENQENASLLESYVDLLGLPLDGSTSEIHDRMRGTTGHHELMMSRFTWLSQREVSIKINTMISSANETDLKNLGELINSLQPDRWSIYQYWPVGPAMKVASEHTLDLDKFQKVTGAIDFEAFTNTTIEVSSAESRRSTYPILNHLGEVYFHYEYPTDDFKYVGLIFDHDISEKISSLCYQEREQATSRYIATNKRVN